jgi:hypothetical protein
VRLGVALYYRCPGPGSCDRRVSTLYWPIFRAPGFLGRSCHRLADESQRIRHKERSFDAAKFADSMTERPRGWT